MVAFCSSCLILPGSTLHHILRITGNDIDPMTEKVSSYLGKLFIDHYKNLKCTTTSLSGIEGRTTRNIKSPSRTSSGFGYFLLVHTIVSRDSSHNSPAYAFPTIGRFV